MFSVPFAATGAFLALLISGTNLSVTSFLGLVILIGVVVNNAIVLIDYTKFLREQGMELVEAILFAGGRRLRPVLITTLTTAGGMLPLAMTKGEGEQLWGPMGKTALGGLLVSSVVTMVLVPTIYIIIAKWQNKKPKIQNT
jgi:HAE1 family hydrophobic/amphiphilic exporter-1